MMNERMKYLRKELLNITMEEFGNHLGVAKSSISEIENNKRGITNQMIKSICREFGVREEWLRNGEGEPFGAKTRNEEILAFANKVMADEDDSIRKRLVSALSKLSEEQLEVLAQIAKELTSD